MNSPSLNKNRNERRKQINLVARKKKTKKFLIEFNKFLKLHVIDSVGIWYKGAILTLDIFICSSFDVIKLSSSTRSWKNI